MGLTAEENELFTRVGPGTPMGELLRRYWLPVAPFLELTEENPTRFVRILGEDLVLFRDRSGRVGLIQDHCPHRGASLLYGRAEERGIACAYHGWLYDVQGNCLETPAEPADSQFYRTVKAKAYPVQSFLGLYWAYLGPEPAPVMPKYELWTRTDGTRRLVIGPNVDCNWFQIIENAVDPWHGMVLHQDSDGKVPLPSATRGTIDEIARIDCWLTPYGIMKQHTMTNGSIRAHPMIFPNILEVINCDQINVPVDDTHTYRVRIYFDPTPNRSIVEGQAEIPVYNERPHKNPADALHPFTRFRMDLTPAQDYMAWETQGPIANRTIERLATSDQWIVWLRDIFRENIQAVQQGLDPFGVIRDPDHAMIETNLEHNIAGLRAGRRRGARAGSE